MPAPNTPPPVNNIGVDTWLSSQAALNAVLRLLASMPHTQVPVAHDCTESGVLALTAAAVKLVRVPDPEPLQDPFDTVNRIDPTTLADGLEVMLEANNPAEAITIAHLYNGGTISGEIDLAGDADAVLDAKGKRLWLQRRGTRVVEVARFGFASGGGTGGPLVEFNNDVDAGGFAVTNLSRKTRDVGTATLTIATTDRDWEIYFTGGTVALPTNPAGWRRGDTVIVVQLAAEMLVTPAVNLVSALDHDRGYGIGAVVILTAHALSNPMKWRIGGITKGATAPGGGGEIERDAAWSLLTTTITSPASSAAYVTAASVTHPTEAGQRWLYIGVGALQFSPSMNVNQGNARLRRSTESGDGPLLMGPRFVQGRESAGATAFRTYSTAQSDINFLIEVQADIDPDAASVTTIYQPGIIGLALETGDFSAANGVAAVSSTAGTFVDGVSLTETFLAEDYLFIGYCQIANSNGQTGATLRLQIDGANHVERQKHKPLTGAMHGGWTCLKQVAMTAGSKTCKVQLALPTGASGNATSTRASLMALKMSAFEEAFYAESLAPASTTSTTLVAAVTITQTWANGWDYLVLANGNLRSNLSQSGTHAKMQVTIAGTNYGHEVRSIPHIDDVYNSCPGLIAFVYRGDGTSKAIVLNYAAGGSSPGTATIADASLAVLALKRA